jgi:epsilon-lactone hydrolase
LSEEKLMPQKRSALFVAVAAFAFFLMLPALGAQEASKSPANPDSCKMDPDGTQHVTRLVPVPGTISPEAQKFISHEVPAMPPPPLAEQRKHTDDFRVGRAAEARKLFPVNIESKTIGGVRCDVITPLSIPAAKRGRVLINVHGGGFITDSGSLVEGIPIANLTKTTVVSVYYRLAPENPFPAAVDDTVAVYKELLKTHQAKNLGLFGTSAGAILTGEVAVELKRLGLPLPAALGIFSGMGDFSEVGDSRALYTIWGFTGYLTPPEHGHLDTAYVGSTNPRNPVLSPLYADLHGIPPTLFITSTRDLLLSGTSILHRAFLRAGDKAELVVFEALPHAFWYDYHLPETREALGLMARFFDENVGK